MTVVHICSIFAVKYFTALEADIKKLPKPAIERLSTLHTFLDELEEDGCGCVSSSGLSRLTGIASHTIRKDISYLEPTGGETGYEISMLKNAIAKGLGIDRPRTVCIVGLGRIGAALMFGNSLAGSPYEIAAGFDSNINRIETIRTKVPLFPACDIADVISRMKIEIGIITVPAESAEQTAARLYEGGIKGIVNLSPAIIHPVDETVPVRNVYVVDQLHVLSSILHQNNK